MIVIVAAVALAHLVLFALIVLSEPRAAITAAAPEPPSALLIGYGPASVAPSRGGGANPLPAPAPPDDLAPDPAPPAPAPRAAAPADDSGDKVVAAVAAALAAPATTPAVGAAAAAAPTAGAGARRCEIFDVVQAALRTDPKVRVAVGLIPPPARSVANAVMIWNGGWADPATLGGVRALDPIRKAVLAGVAQAPSDCQADLVQGPRLVTVGDDRDTTVLAFGSGRWRWSDLLTTASH